MGNAELLIIVIRSYPDLIRKTDSKRRTIFHIALLHRQESVFKLIYEIGAIKDMLLTYVDDEGQNILHLAGQLAPPSRLNMVSGAVFQMQLEIRWFKEVERLVPPSYLNMKSNNREGVEGLTPWDLFTRKHKALRTEGEKWIKDKVNFYIVAATLISAVDFAAVITVPGGSNQDKGTPILLKSIWFRVFFISNATALLTSSASIMIYLSILSSRFAEGDFLTSLPLKWVLGFITLVISIAGMVVAFSATCFLVLKSELTWFPIVIIALDGFLIISFVSQHCKLWFGVIYSAFLPESLCGQRKNRLF
ncbi:ankyrin repeat-containing protein ITN1-like [Quercus lobata]|nr:ankyrin repeat-containing protein ITN1-like [Quercus lobata]